MILLIFGTLEQKDIGLYAAQQKYFSSFILYAFDSVPLPSGYTILGFIFIGLCIRTFKEMPRKKTFGTFITHFAVVLLFFGGFLTALLSEEGFMVIEEGFESSYYSDYHKIELAVIETSLDRNTEKVTAFQEHLLNDKSSIFNNDLGYEIKVINKYKNVKIQRYNQLQNVENAHVSLNTYKLNEIEIDKESELNQSGLILEIEGIRYLLFEDMPFKPHVHINDKHYRLELRQKRTYLPFKIKLNDFDKQTYSGTAEAKSYSSQVEVFDKDTNWQALIEMNEPLRYKGHTFFQSSYIEGTVDSTVLAVVKNYGRLFPYISSIILCFGLLFHLFLRLPKLMRKSAPAFFLIGLLFPMVSNANEEFSPNLNSFSKIPVIENGRIKPLDSFARHQLLQFSARESIDDLNASEWILELLLTPQKAYEREVFKISNPSVVNILALPKREKSFYSFEEIVPAMRPHIATIQKIKTMQITEATAEEQQLLRLHENSVAYYDISRSFSFILPLFILNSEQANYLNLEPNKAYNYLDLKAYEVQMKALANEYPTKDNNVLWTRYQKISEDEKSTLLKIIPWQWGDDQSWYSPWQTFTQGQGSPKTAEFFKLWKNMTLSYLSQNQVYFDEVLKLIYEDSFKLRPDQYASLSILKLEFEFFYNTIKPFDLALFFAIFSFLIWMLSKIYIHKMLYKLIGFGLFTSLAFQTLGIAMRMFIMWRPPVATLYESILFVSWVALIFAIAFESRRKDALGYFIGSILTIFLLFVAMRYALDGDTMGNLVAVLNTNFWLATHVLTITIGYGGCLVAAILGHVYLVARLRRKDALHLSKLHKNMVGVALVSLFFATLGTILGGIWADQSWGRFWGWDPKENGAMFVCLWLIWILHGRISGFLKPNFFAALMALTSVVIAFAWFGVNLLGVGLHSYGFTENIAFNLFLFTAVEIALISALLGLNYYQPEKKAIPDDSKV